MNDAEGKYSVREPEFSKNTLIIGGAFWTVLMGLSVWSLTTMVSVKETLGRISERMDGQSQWMQLMGQRQTAIEQRMGTLERQTDVIQERISQRHEERR